MEPGPPPGRLHSALTCSLCLDVFVEPVLLSCGCCFCRRCITSSWDSKARVPMCPECRQPSPGRQCTPNPLLETLVKRAWGCPRKHGAPVQLFCISGEALICYRCLDSSARAGHQFSSLKDAAQRYKVNGQGIVRQVAAKPVSGLLQTADGTDMTGCLSILGVGNMWKTPFQHWRSGIIAATEQQKGHILTFECLVEDTDAIFSEGEMGCPADWSLWKTGSVPTCFFALCDLRKERMARVDNSLLQHFSLFLFSSPELEPVRLDPNTAHPIFAITNKGMCVVVQETLVKYKNNPQRFRNYWIVLGKNGFTSGRHYWEVETEDQTGWVIGLVAESIERKKLGPNYLKDKLWGLKLEKIESISSGASTSCWQIGVYLDYEEGQISFYDGRNGVHLLTYRAQFKEKVYPFFHSYSILMWISIKIALFWQQQETE
uniref:Uncharacterized protein n=1 Tax=Varanus komodoensis TaxID=61221 RepID=A0A8D2J9A5_VARKO